MQIRRVDTEILGAVRKQSSSGSRAKYVHPALKAVNAIAMLLTALRHIHHDMHDLCK